MSTMLCISRYTDDTYTQQFGNGRNKFYIEFRCNMPCAKGLDVCSKCIDKSATSLQTSRKFNHGKVNEPIPEDSHIFGGAWYKQAVKKYGEPSSDVIEFALQYQKKAREGYTFEEPVEQSEKKEEPILTGSNKRTQKPKVAASTTTAAAAGGGDNKAEPNKAEPTKRVRKPKVAVDISQNIVKTSKKDSISPYSSLINSTNQLVHKEVVLPTHIETSLEEFDTDGFEIEYIKLEVFEANGTTYFRDRTKNKLYKKIKDKGIGCYIGRWNPNTELIVTDIPDSDDEE
jgi:hypothetical protein